MAIPYFDHNLVIPPHKGSPIFPEDVSPYACSSFEVCTRFATTPRRVDILNGFLEFRKRLNMEGLVTGFQWLDGSFLEDVETRELRSPNDLDVVTIYWGYDMLFQNEFVSRFPAFNDNRLSKAEYYLDHYIFDADYKPEITVNTSRYWIQLFSHNRDSVWKGMLQVPLNTPGDDQDALDYLKSK